MKKLFVFLLSLSVILVSGCTSLSDLSDKMPIETESTPASEEVTQAQPEETASGALTVPEFEVTVEEVISVLETNVKDTVSVLPSDVTPEISKIEATETSSAYISYVYELFDGFAIGITASPDSEKVQTVSVFTVADKLSETTAYDVGAYEAILVAMFEPDSDALAQVDTDLNIADSSFSEDNVYFATGTIAQFVYAISGGTATLIISPPS